MRRRKEEGCGPCVLASLRLCVVLLLLAPLRPSALASQNDPRLITAVRLAQEGQSDSARALVGRVLAQTSPADTLYAQVLYAVGLLAHTESDRRLYLRRVVVEHGRSEWADDALLQLAQLDYAAGNAEGAAQQAERLLLDYPESPLIPVAALWGSRAAGDRRDAETACRIAEAGLAAVGHHNELRTQLEFQRQRCQSLAAIAAANRPPPPPPTDTARAAPRDPARPAPVAPDRPRPGWYVQVSAVRSQEAAAADLARLRRAGNEGLVVREGGLLKIRVGPYRSREGAAASMAGIRQALGGQPFIVQVPPP